MKKLHFLFGILALIITSCTKNRDVVKTFAGNLPIVSTNSPTTATVGQNIISTIRCELTSLSGSVNFKNFDIKEISAQQFNITAIALYKDWNTQIAMPVMWTIDTTASIKTTTIGKYILNFYNSSLLFKSDMVQVN